MNHKGNNFMSSDALKQFDFASYLYKYSSINIICLQMYSKTSKGLFFLALLLVLAASQQVIGGPYCSGWTADNTTCTNCYTGYYLNETKICVFLNKICKINQYDVNNGNCLIDCYVDYTLVDGDCVLDLPAPPHCSNYVSPNCFGCFNGYYLDPITGCTELDPLCKTYTPTYTCATCYDGYYVNTQNICTRGSDLCASFTNAGDGACASCWSGSVVSGSTCVTAPAPVPVATTFDPKCNNWQQNPCTDCQWGYFTKNGGCAQVPQSSYCQGYDKNTGGCTGCPWGRKLSKDSGAADAVCIPN